jgi:hypothetical protein
MYTKAHIIFYVIYVFMSFTKSLPYKHIFKLKSNMFISFFELCETFVFWKLLMIFMTQVERSRHDAK